jgi:restriction endonuclease S subunit
MSSRQAYTQYKPSGVSWLGDIPEHWEIRRLKYSADLINTKIDGAAADLPYTGLEHIESWTGKRISPNVDITSEGQANLYGRGDVLFGKLRPYLAKAHAAEIDGICTGELLVLRPKAVKQKFLLNYVLNPDFVAIVDSSTYGAKMPRANWEFIGNLPALIPPMHEQQTIESFLDREMARIDALIEKKQQQIELLLEKRSALISHAVTKGLDPNAKMKDSGVEWIGSIPTQWEVKRLKFLVSEPLKYGANEAAELDDPELPRYIRITDVDENGRLRDETFKSIPEDVARPYLLKEGDLLLARSGATVGKSFYYEPSWGRAAYAGYLIRARFNPTKTMPRFINYFTNSQQYWQWLSASFIQATIQNVSAEKYANLIVPVPPFEEQKRIVSYLDSMWQRLNNMTDKVRQSIQGLKEYRSALISAAVTGKIDVRGEVE